MTLNYKASYPEKHSVIVGGNGAGIYSEASIDLDGLQANRNYIWNTNTLAWEKSTGGGTPGSDVTVTNFPASYPVTGTFWQTIQPTSSKSELSVSSPTSASIGVTSAEAVPANASRKGLVLVNTSANYVSIAFGAAAVLYSGITLNPGGGAWWMDEYCFTTSQIRAIASGATSNLAIQEFV